MSTTFLGLRTVGYYVSDLQKAKEYYTTVLGVAPYFDEPFYVGYNVAGYELGLMPFEDTDMEPRAAITYWGVDDVADAYANLLNAGAQPLNAPQDVGGGIVVAAVTDPMGNVFGVICNPHFKL